MKMSKTRKMFSLLGFMLVGLSIILILAPGLVQIPEIPGLIRQVGIWIAIGLLGLYMLKSFSLRSLDHEKLYLVEDRLPETVNDPEEDLTFELEASTEDMREVVKKVLEQEHGKSEEESEKMIKNGEWASSSVSKAFIDDSIDYTVFERLRAWIEDSGTEERRMLKTLDSIEKLHRRGRN